MDNSFDDVEIAIIAKELSKKTYSDIAFLIDRSVEEVTAFINQYLEGKDLVSHQQLVNQKKQARPPVTRKPREKKEKKKELVIISRIIELPKEKLKKTRAGEIIFRTKVTDYSKMQQVKIDSKTWIFIKAGEDPHEAKQRYFNRLVESKSKMVDSQGGSWSKVSNFK
jgi:hypothetical protein